MAWQHENQMSYNMPIKVHINPNFRGKPMVFGGQGSGERPAGIHFNPHWKPKTGEVLISKASEDAVSHTQISSQRRTIHINPKVIPNGIPPSISTLLQQENVSTDTVSTPIIAYKGEIKLNAPQSQWLNEERAAISSDINKKSSEINFSSKNSFSTTPAQIFRKNIGSANSPTIRTAKIVRTKYKYLNSAIQLHTSYPRLLNNQIEAATTSASCSRFKYVKKVENQSFTNNSSTLPKSDIVSRFKIVKGSVTSGHEGKINNTSYALTPRRLRAQRILENVKNIPELTVKSRFKVLKSTDVPQLICAFNNRSVMNTRKSKTTSRYKFVRQTTQSHRFSLKRKSPRVVKSRFKIIREIQPTRTTRYRLVHNLHGTISHKQRSYLPISPFGRRNRWVNSKLDLQATKVVITNKKLLRIGRRPDSRHNKADKMRKAKLLNIGGVFYRSTRTTLTLSSNAAASTSIDKARPYAGKGQVLSIRGSRFVLDKTGRTLQRLTSNKLPVFRIHIGGVTFVPSSENTLVRSRVHETRNLVSQAKQRSIAVLTSKLRKNNQPCLIYQRFGKCRLHDKGSCPKVHDPKKIAICNDFVNGKCLKSAADCRLSHDVGPEKMPTCHFFLEGCCVRDPCPYSHVKLNKKAAVCRDFLTGYCSAGDKCKKRHVFLCPEFEEHKRCSKGKYCIYRHAGEVERKTTYGRDDESAPKEPPVPTTSKETVDPLTRYYLKKDGADIKDGGGQSRKLESNACLSECKEETVVLLPERSKLGDLPGFIPL